MMPRHDVRQGAVVVPKSSNSDIIMVGEMRDLRRRKLLFRSLTGHLLSTLHTNDAPGAVTRLVDMGTGRFGFVHPDGGVGPTPGAQGLQARTLFELQKRSCPCQSFTP
jgi:hypothetical protein